MNHVSWTSILIGLALFLFGIDYLSLSLQELSPTRLKRKKHIEKDQNPQ